MMVEASDCSGSVSVPLSVVSSYSLSGVRLNLTADFCSAAPLAGASLVTSTSMTLTGCNFSLFFLLIMKFGEIFVQ